MTDEQIDALQRDIGHALQQKGAVRWWNLGAAFEALVRDARGGEDSTRNFHRTLTQVVDAAPQFAEKLAEKLDELVVHAADVDDLRDRIDDLEARLAAQRRNAEAWEANARKAEAELKTKSEAIEAWQLRVNAVEKERNELAKALGEANRRSERRVAALQDELRYANELIVELRAELKEKALERADKAEESRLLGKGDQ